MVAVLLKVLCLVIFILEVTFLHFKQFCKCNIWYLEIVVSFVRFQVLMVASMAFRVFWAVVRCSLIGMEWHFRPLKHRCTPVGIQGAAFPKTRLCCEFYLYVYITCKPSSWIQSFALKLCSVGKAAKKNCVAKVLRGHDWRVGPFIFLNWNINTVLRPYYRYETVKFVRNV
jgi:hypothetical protein